MVDLGDRVFYREKKEKKSWLNSRAMVKEIWVSH